MTNAEKALKYFIIAVPEDKEQAEAYFWARRALNAAIRAEREEGDHASIDREAWEPCERCTQKGEKLDRFGAHDFQIDGTEIYFHDTDDGWEGEEINFCPWCGRPLTDEAVDMVMERLEALQCGN